MFCCSILGCNRSRFRGQSQGIAPSTWKCWAEGLHIANHRLIAWPHEFEWLLPVLAMSEISGDPKNAKLLL